MRALPNLGISVTAANAAAASPRLDYQINFPTVANDWRIWVRMYSAVTTDRILHVSIGTTLSPVAAPAFALSNTSNSTWQWVQSPAINITATGNRYVSLFMGEDGLQSTRSSSCVGHRDPADDAQQHRRQLVVRDQSDDATRRRPATAGLTQRTTTTLTTGTLAELLRATVHRRPATCSTCPATSRSGRSPLAGSEPDPRRRVEQHGDGHQLSAELHARR